MTAIQAVHGKLPLAVGRIAISARAPDPRGTTGASPGSVSGILKGIGRRVVPIGETTGRRREGERSSERSGSSGEEREVTIEEQMPVVEEFLTGLVGAFGLEGAVDVSIDGDVIVANVAGSQTEAMVGPRGAVIESIHELTKTVLHRRTQSSARLRLDVAGYAERRRQALSIYANQLLDQVTQEGGEVMLEPMSAADRKVIHDAVAQREGVRSYSEGQAPQRYVVISAEVPSAMAAEGSSEEE